MKKRSSCGYEWTLQLISQNNDNLLDRCLHTILSDVLREEGIFSLYFSKSLSIKQRPCLMLSNYNQFYDDDNLAEIPEHEVVALVERLAKLNHDVEMLFLSNRQVIPIRYQGLVLGFLELHIEQLIPTNIMSVLMHVLNVYVHQLATLHYARVDPMTQLLNRQTFDEKVMDIVSGNESWFKRKEDKVRTWYIGMADIDLFKKVNDTYGHVIGDEVILLVAQLLKSSFRAEDYVFRYGGEEFAILFPCDNEDAAWNMLDRVRETIASTRFPQVNNVTISVGFAQLNDAAEVTQFVNKADKALYHSKELGRNRVTAYSSIQDDPNNPYSDDIELF